MFTYSVLPTWFEILKIFFRNNSKQFDEYIKKLNNNNQYRLLSSSSWSIMIICILRIKLKKQKKINLYVPEYFCFNALKFIDRKIVNIIYFKIDENLNPLLNDKDFNMNIEKNKPDIMLYVNYFGEKNNINLNFLKFHDLWLIEDCTHCIEINKQIGNTGNFVIMSLYKNFALPNGAILSLNKNNQKNLNDVTSYFENNEKWNDLLKHIYKEKPFRNLFDLISDFLWVLKKVIQKIFNLTKIIKYENFYKNNYISYGSTNPYFSTVSKKILIHQIKKLNIIKIKKNLLNSGYEILIENQNYNNNKILNYNFKKNYYDKLTPYNFRYKSKKIKIKFLFQKLNKLKLPVYLWPDLPPQIYKQKKTSSFNLFANIIHIANPQSIKLKSFIKYFKFAHRKKNISNSDIEVKEKNYLQDSDRCEKFNITQSPSYASSIINLSKNKWKVKRLLFKTKNTKIAYCQILVRKFFIFKIYRINKGPIFFNNVQEDLKQNVINYLISLGNIKKFSILFFIPNLPYNIENIIILKKKSFIFNIDPKFSTIILDLNKELDLIKSEFKYFWKYSLNRSLKHNIEIKLIKNNNEFNKFCSRYIEQSKTNKFKSLNINLLKELFEINSKTNLLIFQAIYDNKCIGEICIHFEGNTATYLIGNFNDYGKKFNANNLLLWEGIKFLKKKNINFFDLGGLNLQNESGINFFKRGMGGKEIISFPECIFI